MDSRKNMTNQNIQNNKPSQKIITTKNNNITDPKILLENIENTFDNLKSSNNNIINEIEKYDIKDEEEEIDKDIQKLKNAFDVDVSNSDDTSDTSSDISSDDSNDNNEEHNEHPEIARLKKYKDDLAKDLAQKEKFVEKVNSQLNDELFIKRCKEQDERRKKEKHNEEISVLVSDKNTYLIMLAKINKGILKERNITPLFKFKYHIIKFMSDNNMISLKSNDNTENELAIFKDLSKVINSMEHDNPEILDDINENYVELCEKFSDYLDSIDDNIVSDTKVHQILNENPNIKEHLFGKSVDTTIFNRDTPADFGTK